MKSRSGRQNLIWLAIYVIATVSLLYCLETVVSSYISEPYVTVTKKTRPTKLPKLTYCPADGAHPEKVLRENLTMKHYEYMLFHFPNSFRVEAYNGNHDITKRVRDELLPLGADVSRKRKLLNISFTELFLKLSLTEKDVIFYKSPKIRSSRILSTFGICFIFEPQFLIDGLIPSKLNVQLRLLYDPPYAFAQMPTVDRISIGDRAAGTFPEPVYRIPRNTYNVDIAVTAIKSTRLVNCKTWTLQDQASCYTDCMFKGCPGSCSLNNLSNIVQGACTALDWPCLQVLDPNRTVACDRQCPTTCMEWIYTAAITFIPMNLQNTTGICMSYANPLHSFVFVERKLFTPVEYLSQIGGLVSLWFGSSLLTIPTLCFWLYYWLKKKQKKNLVIIAASFW